MKKILWLIPLLASCTLSNNEIEEREWKYYEGYRVGDFLYFDGNTYHLKGNDMYKYGQKVAVVVKATPRKLTIKSINSDSIGVYTILGKEND